MAPSGSEIEFPAASHVRKQLVDVLLPSAMSTGMPSGAETKDYECPFSLLENGITQ